MLPHRLPDEQILHKLYNFKSYSEDLFNLQYKDPVLQLLILKLLILKFFRHWS